MRDSWVEVTIGEEINLLNGFPFNSSKFNENKIGFPLIRIRDLLKSSQKTFFDGVFSETYVVRENDILVGMDGDFHIVRWKNSESLLNQRILKISQKAKSSLDVNFLYYFLQPFLLDVHAKTAATTVKHLSSYAILNANVNLPPLPQQKKIAQILSTADTVLAQTEAAIAKYQALKQGMLQDLFTRGIDTATGQLRASYKVAPELYKETELGFVPREWKKLKFGDEINLLNGYPFNSAKFNNEKRGIPLIRIRNLLTSSQETFFEGSFINNYLVKEDDVLVGMDGDFHIVRWNNSPSLLNQRILKLYDKENGKLKIDYFFYYLGPFLLDIHNKTVATTVKHLSSYDIINAEKYMPSLSEQNLAAEKLKQIDQKIHTEQQTLAKYQQLKAGLMQDLLSGVVGVEGLVDNNDL